MRSDHHRIYKAHHPPQQTNSASSMPQGPYWISPISRSMSFHLSNHVWEVSMPSSNTMTCVLSIESNPISLTYPSQGCKDVEDKLGDLVLWLIKLKDSVTATSADDNPQEAQRREHLTRFPSPFHPLSDPSQSHALGPWKTLGKSPGSCWTKERLQGSSIKGKIQEWLSSSSKNFGRQSSSTRFVPFKITGRAELMPSGLAFATTVPG